MKQLTDHERWARRITLLAKLTRWRRLTEPRRRMLIARRAQ